MQQYGAWLIQSDQLDQAVIFLRTLSMILTGLKGLVYNNWNIIVKKTIDFVQEETRKNYNACLILT